MKNIIVFSIVGVILLAACTAEIPQKKLVVESIVSSAEPIVPGEPFPRFTEHFASGTTVVYSYVSFENTETMTGDSFPVRLRWFYPNDFRPPIAQRTVELAKGQRIAQFSIHNESGLPNGPYMLISAYGKNEMSLTETGSARFYVGMTEEEAKTFVTEETDFRTKRDAEIAKREEERKAQEALSAAWAEKWRANMVGKDTFDVDRKAVLPKLKEGVKPEDLLPKETSSSSESSASAASSAAPPEQDAESSLPPALTDGS